MRIALVSQEYPPRTAKGGIGTQTYLKAHGLAALGHDVCVISRTEDGTDQSCQDGPVEVVRVPGFNQRMPVYTEAADWLTYSAQVAVAVSRLNKRSPLDLVEFPEWGAEGYVHLLNRTEWNYIPTAIHLHGPLVMFAHTMGWPELDSEFYRTGIVMEGTCLRLADAVFSSSDCSADWCARHYGLKREQIPTIHTGVDTGHFYPRPVPKASRPTIIFVGKIARNKGVDVLLEAACRLAGEFPDLHLRLLGRGDESLVTELQRRANATGYPDLLDLPGFVDRQDLPDHLSRAHIFAAPSVYEGGPGFVYLEAMACGLPVIACQGSGAAEVVHPGRNGFLVPPEDVASLTETLHRLLTRSEERETLGRLAREYVKEEADSSICLRRLEAYYLSLVSRVKNNREVRP